MDNSILINNVQIFDGSSEQTGRGNVLVVNSRIKTVSESPIPTDGIPNVTILDGKGKFLMPGLIDAHWHAYMSCNTMMDLLTADTAYTQFTQTNRRGRSPCPWGHSPSTGCPFHRRRRAGRDRAEDALCQTEPAPHS